MSKYDDIIDMPHHVSPTRQPMPLESRAAQFAPFAALSGHEEAISETARYTSAGAELDESAAAEIDRKLQCALNSGEHGSDIAITFFCPDRWKPGGRLMKVTGIVSGLDKDRKHLVMNDGTLIPIDNITDIDI